MSINSKFYGEDIKNVTEIQFGIYTNDMIKKNSAVKNDPFGINVSDSYDNYEPKKGGLVDLRLGTCDIYLNCTTCGLNSIECPGHFGHTELAEPVFHYGFLNHLISVIKCICHKCSNILIERNDTNMKRFQNKLGKNRFKELKELTKNINFCSHCGTPVPKIKKEVKESSTSIRIILEKEVGSSIIDEKTGVVIDSTKIIKDYLSPRQCYYLLRNISDSDAHMLGFTINDSRPEDLIITRFPVPPVIIRPTAKIDFLSAASMEDSLTLKIADIINWNIRIRNEMNKESTAFQDSHTLLQFHVATYFDNDSASLPKSEFKTGNRPTNSISDRIKGKEGRMRMNIMGKRVDFSARSVITSDPYIDIDMVGIPLKVAKDLTIPEEVTPFNIKSLSQLVLNGRDIYPGANYVFRNIILNGKQISQKIDLRYRKTNIKLSYGDVVERHVVNGDYVLFNRQPTLHKPSMMGHKVHVLNRDDTNTFRMNVSVCGPYGADFDGDEMNIHLAQSIQARNELERIANVKYQIIGGKDSNPIIGCVQDTIAGAYLLSQDTSIPYDIASNLLCTTISKKSIEMIKHQPISGSKLFSYIIPSGINMIKKNFQVKNGQLVEGILDKSQLSKSRNSIIHYIWDKYGPTPTQQFIDDTQRLVLSYLLNKGLTIGFKDCIVESNIIKQINEIVHTKILSINHMITQFENDKDKITPEMGENILTSDLNTVSSNISKIVFDSLDRNNAFNIIISSGAKGSKLNFGQIGGCFGQSVLEGQRIKKKISGRTLPIFHQNDDTPKARGFINNNFLDGLKGHEFYFHTSSGREGLIDTAIKTAESGYIQRKLVKSLEDMYVNYEGMVRTANGVLVQYLYGDCGIDQQRQTQITINLLNYGNKMVREKFIFTKDEMKLVKDYDNEMMYNKMIEFRDKLRSIYFKSTSNYKVIVDNFMLPVNLFRITQEYMNNAQVTTNDLSPKYIVDSIEKLLQNYDDRLVTIMKNDSILLKKDDLCFKFIFSVALYEYIGPKRCIVEYKLSKENFDNMMKDIKLAFSKAMVEPGEMVGIVAAQSIGEPTSQMSVVITSGLKLIVKNMISNIVTFKSVNIGKLCDEIIEKNPSLTNNTGHINSVETDLSSLNDEYYIIGVDKNEKTHWNKISHVSRHPVNGMLMKVTTKSGRSVTTTMSHSHLIRSNQTVVPITGSDLKVGMRIPIAKYIDNVYINKTVVIGKIEYVLDNLFGWFIGAYLAEGSILNSKVSISNISDHFINTTTEFAQKFNSSVKVRKYKGEYGPSTSTSFNHIELALFIVETCGTGSFVKRVPDFAFTAPNEFKAGLIQAYFDGDGNFQCDKTRSQIRVCSRSEILIKDMSLLLSYFDIFGSIKMNKVKGSLLYNLAISSKYGPSYKNNIGSSLHLDKLDAIISYTNRSDIHNLSDEIDKINGLGDIIARCGKVLRLEGQSRTYGRWDKKDSIGRRTLSKYIEVFESHENANSISNELAILKQAANSNVIWDEIVSIDITTPDQTEYVYDFTVPGNQTFMIDNGIIVHNTLNTKHFAGVAGKGSANSGVPRIKELLSYSKSIKTPHITIYLNQKYSKSKSDTNVIASYLKHLTIGELIDSAEILYCMNGNDKLSETIRNDKVSNPFYINNIKDKIDTMPFIIRLKMNLEKMMDKETTLLDIKTKFITYWYKNFANLKNVRKGLKDILMYVEKIAILSNNDNIIHIRFKMSDFDYKTLTSFLTIVLNTITLKGIDNINNITQLQERKIEFTDEGEPIVNKENIIITDGINIDGILHIKGIDHTRVKINDIYTIYCRYGIEAARKIIIDELLYTFNEGGSNSLNHAHISLLVDLMTYSGEVISIDRHGLNKIDNDPLSRASFEKTMEHFVNAALFSETDKLKSVSSRIALGRVIPGGTGAFDIILDTNMLKCSEYIENETGGRTDFIPLQKEPLFEDIIKYGLSDHNFFIPK